MSKGENWLPTSIKVLKKSNDTKEKELSNYNKAIELAKPLMEKFNCKIAEIPTKKITDKEKSLFIRIYMLLGYKKESAELLSK